MGSCCGGGSSYFTNRAVFAACDDELMLVDELNSGDGLHMGVEDVQQSRGLQGLLGVRVLRWVALVVFFASIKPFGCL